MHDRQKILNELRTQLKNSTYFAGVWVQRVIPNKNVFPCVTLFADNETVDTLTIHNGNRPQDRFVNVSIVGWVKGARLSDEQIEIELSIMSAEIEKQISPPTGAIDIKLDSTDYLVDDAEPELHSIKLNYLLNYGTSERTPET